MFYLRVNGKVDEWRSKAPLLFLSGADEPPKKLPGPETAEQHRAKGL
tara:strand:+ start:383 stop:523 length:141 start_codon:yes stop_codon:yes gene_type:complete